MAHRPPGLDAEGRAALQRRTIVVLSAGQVLGGISFGATISLGAILAAKLSGDDALSGLATASITLGTALTAVPLAGLARRRGRRPALATGMLIALAGVGLVLAAITASAFALLLVGFVLIGAGQASNLQSRFAATDLATDASRARDLSLVIWATTIGAVLGPNLAGPGEALGAALGMPQYTGPYLFTIAAQLLGIALVWTALRPDPLITAHQAIAARAAGSEEITHIDRPRAAGFATVAIIGAHAVMVSIMAMTPIHLVHHGADLTVVGLTISLHIAGMYALSPVFGVLADRWGRVRTILLGYAILAGCVAVIALDPHSATAVTVALVLLGLGWSAATVAGAALLTESSAESLRTRRQGRNDFWMSIAGALGALGAGGALGWAGFDGLALLALPILAVVVLLSPLARR
ncbi:MAG: MFS transporter [Nigerium sp.]|nr:MFS transporter [Nigerium sp.]